MKSNATVYVFLFYDSIVLSLGLAVEPILCNKNFSSECLQSFFHLFIYQIHLWKTKLRNIKPCHQTGPTKVFKCGYLPTQHLWRPARGFSAAHGQRGPDGSGWVLCQQSLSAAWPSSNPPATKEEDGKAKRQLEEGSFNPPPCRAIHKHKTSLCF